MLTDDDKRYMLNEFLKHLSHIQDKEYQNRVWINGKGPEVDDFDETVNNFSDLGDPILENYKDYGITETQHHLLIAFKNEFKAFYDEHDLPEEFIDTLEWKRIMEKAKEVVKALGRL
jgi:hypothetical protein